VKKGGQMDKNVLLKKCMETLQRTPLMPGYQDLIKEIQGTLAADTRDRMVIKMDGGCVQGIIADRPIEILKIEEAGDLESDDLLEMYPEGSGMYSGDTHVFAVIREAECDPETMKDEFIRYEKALAEKNMDASLDMSP
jgi:hypothetical protein